MTQNDLQRLVAEVQSRQSELNNVEVKAAQRYAQTVIRVPVGLRESDRRRCPSVWLR
jgi:hypothetical protein